MLNTCRDIIHQNGRRGCVSRHVVWHIVCRRSKFGSNISVGSRDMDLCLFHKLAADTTSDLEEKEYFDILEPLDCLRSFRTLNVHLIQRLFVTLWNLCNVCEELAQTRSKLVPSSDAHCFSHLVSHSITFYDSNTNTKTEF